MKRYKLFKVKVLNRYRNSQGQYIREQFVKCFLFTSLDSEEQIKHDNTKNHPSHDTYAQQKVEIKFLKSVFEEVSLSGYKEYDYDVI